MRRRLSGVARGRAEKFIFNCSMEDARRLPFLVPVMARRPKLSMQKNQFGMRVTGRSSVRNGESVVVVVVLR